MIMNYALNVHIISKAFDIATYMFVYFKNRVFNDIYNVYINRTKVIPRHSFGPRGENL